MARSRGWCFTTNNPTEAHENEAYGLAWKVKYIVVGKEIGESGTPHLQGYIYYQDKKSFAQVQHDVPEGSHIEVARGTAQQNFEYCSKDGDFYENGERPLTNKEKGEKNSERWEEARIACREGRIADIPTDIGIHLAKLQYLVNSEKMTRVNLSDTDEKMEWYWGPSGCGKSRRAREENPEAYLKMCNKWWDGYGGEEVVIIEDFDKEHKVLCHHMKIWCDRYKFPAEVKGGKIDIRPRKIIVTSNYHPSQIWENEQDLGPILRRFRVTDMSAPIVFGN